MLETVYQTRLPDKKARQDLLSKLGVAMADIIYQCERTAGSNLDSNLSLTTLPSPSPRYAQMKLNIL